MKTKRILALLLVFVLAFTVVSCGGKDELVGKWEVIFSDEELEEAEEYGMSMQVFLEFTKDGQAQFIFEMDEEMEKTLGEEMDEPPWNYKVDGDQLTMEREEDGESMTEKGTYKIEDGILSITFDGQTEKFKRAK